MCQVGANRPLRLREQPVSRGYSVVQTARLVCTLRWTCGRLSEMLKSWAAEAAAAPENADAAVSMSELSCRLASHRESLDRLQPDSELMASWKQEAPADPSLTATLEEIAALEGSLERLDVARSVIVPHLLDAYLQIGERAAPHCDAALASAARSLGYDLERDPRDGRAAPGGAAQQPVVDEAERMLSAVGGIVGPLLLQPDGWP